MIRAVAIRAQENTGPGALTGDALTAAYVKAAAGAAAATASAEMDGPDRVSGFLIGLGVALDDTDTLLNDPQTSAAVKAIESEAERGERLAVLGNPTIRGRRDLCRRFAIGCGASELLTPQRAEAAAVGRTVAAATPPRLGGISFPGLAAEFGGIAFARSLREDPEGVRRVAAAFTPAEYLPNTDGLQDGLSAERFADDYGDVSDDRFGVVLADIRKRSKAVRPGGR